MNVSTDKRDEIFAFLDIVRESGSINMFAAAPQIQEFFGLSRVEAKDILLEWMMSFEKRASHV